jgi:hypothetical protein
MIHKTDLKVKYLGDSFIGQELCWCRITIGANAVSVERCDGTRLRTVRWIEQLNEVLAIKAKLRAYLPRMRSLGRWGMHRTTQGTVYLTIYYPSRSWDGRTGKVRLFGEEGAI